MKKILSIDQGTTSTRAIVYDDRCRRLAASQREFTQHFPRPAWVEHDAAEIWRTVRETASAALAAAGGGIGAIGITNQRETVVVWDRKTGEPAAPAIVWQDRRTAPLMEELKADGREPLVREKTGLLLDPYFSAGKLRWLLENIPDGLARARGGELAAGTIDSWLLFKLSGGRRHVTEIGNASRTLLMDIRTGAWDRGLLDLFGIPAAVLPEIVPSSGALAVTDPALFGAEIPVTGAAGDQQAALFGQLCDKPGMVKCTYGTGCFMLLFTGPEPAASRNRLLTTVAWKLDGAATQYALEGSVFMGGATVQWLRDGLKIIRSAPEVNELAAQVPDTGGVYLVPAFTGLGAPYWDAGARGAIVGMTRGTTGAHIARAALEGIAFQVTDLLAAMRKDSGRRIAALRVDGGACASDLLMQLQADLAGVAVDRPLDLETTALGAAMLAGLGAGVWRSLGELEAIRTTGRVFRPAGADLRRERLRGWKKAVKSSRAAGKA